MAAALTENACDGIGTVPVILVLKAVFLCSPEQGTREQSAIGDAFDRFGVVPRGLLPMFPRWFDRSLILWDFWDLCCEGPNDRDMDTVDQMERIDSGMAGKHLPYDDLIADNGLGNASHHGSFF